MGAWNTSLYGNDTARDVKGDYVHKLRSGKSDQEAMEAMLVEYERTKDDEDEGPLFWLALADTQWEYGRARRRFNCLRRGWIRSDGAKRGRKSWQPGTKPAGRWEKSCGHRSRRENESVHISSTSARGPWATCLPIGFPARPAAKRGLRGSMSYSEKSGRTPGGRGIEFRWCGCIDGSGRTFRRWISWPVTACRRSVYIQPSFCVTPTGRASTL